MRRSIEIGEFRAAYRRAVEELVPLVAAGGSPEPRFAIPASRDELGLRGYLTACETIYVEALRGPGRDSRQLLVPGSAVDAGGSYGALALALAALGVPVQACEPAGRMPLSPTLEATLERASVGLLPSEPGASETSDSGVDLVVCVALLPAVEVAGAAALAASRLDRTHGRLVLGVPNAAYWPRRIRELARRDAPAPAEGAAALDERRWTAAELRDTLRGDGLRVESVRGCNVSPRGMGGPKQQLVYDLVLRAAPRWREVLVATAARGA